MLDSNFKSILHSNTWILLILLIFSSCNKKADPNQEKLLIAVAANVQFAMQEIEKKFEKETGIPVDQVISSSGKLTAQILQGAPYDIFVSADVKYPDTLYKNGFATAPPRVYAYGTLVLWTFQGFDLANGLDILKNPLVQKIAIANPATAPYGEQTIRLLRHYNLYDQIQPKLVYGESIAQTNQYITSSACELGFTAKSIVLAPEMQGKGAWVEIDAAAYEPIQQGVIITKFGNTEHPEASQRFFDYLFSEKGRAILEKHGYQLPVNQTNSQ